MGGTTALLLSAECGGGYWWPVRDGDARARSLYSRHYSSAGRNSRAAKIIGPGEYMLLLTLQADAVFAWRVERFRLDNQTGVNCAIFRNESRIRSSDLIREACALAWSRWPGSRLFTFVNAAQVASRNPGYCFLMAGWHKCGVSKGGLLIFEVQP